MSGLGWLPDPPKLSGQKQDWNAAILLGSDTPPIRASAREHILSILNQGDYPTCVSHAIFQAIRAAHSRIGIENPVLGSRLFGNYLSKASHGAQLLDQGTYIRTMLDSLKEFGFPPESLWPYLDVTVEEKGKPRWALMPPAASFRGAFDQRQPIEFRKIYETGYAR